MNMVARNTVSSYARPACGWRSFMTVVVFLLMNTAANAFTLPLDPTRAGLPARVTPPITTNHDSVIRSRINSDLPVGKAKMTRLHNSLIGSSSLDVAAGVTSGIGSPIASVAVLASIILIHELGHYLAAVSMGITVQEFNVGIGPKLFGFTSTKNVDFNLRAIPFGGYVQFPENYNRTLLFQRQDEVREARQAAQVAQELAQEKAQQRVAAQSRLLGALTLGWYTKQQQKEQASKLETEEQTNKLLSRKGIFSFLPGAQPSKSSSSSKNKSLDSGIKDPVIEYYDNENLLQNRPWGERGIVLVGGVVFNILLAFACYLGEVTLGQGLPHASYGQGAVIAGVPRADGPSAGLLQRGDVILTSNGQELMSSLTQPTSMISQSAIANFISQVRDTPPGETIQLTIVHPNYSEKTTSLKTITVKPERLFDETGSNNRGPPSIGVVLSPNIKGIERIKATSPQDALQKAGTAVYEVTSQTASSLVGFFASLLSGRGPPAGQGMSGPIGLIKTGSQIASSSDWSALVAFAAAISINLAVINSLPLPALDGGQLVFVLAEAVSGRKIDQQIQENINGVALLGLLLLSLSTAVGDLGSIFFR